MGITVHAVVTNQIDYAAIRADGYEAVISMSACNQIAHLVHEIPGVVAFPAEMGEEEQFYGSHVPSLSVSNLDAAVQCQLRALIADNAPALAIFDKIVEHRVKATFTRDCGDNQYRIRMVSAPADHVDVPLSGGNWKQFRDAIGVNGDDPNSDIDCGELAVDVLEEALDESHAALIFSGEWHQQLVAKLRRLIAYAKANDATILAWA